MSKKLNGYIHCKAWQIIVEMEINFIRYDQYSPQEVCGQVYFEYQKQIRGFLLQASFATKAKIASFGKANGKTFERFSLEDVHRRSGWLNGSLSGEALIIEIATTAIGDLIIADRAKRKFQPPVGHSDYYRGGGGYSGEKAWCPNLDDYDRWMK